MSPQFVDFNGDGHTDIVTATFDGSPWVSLGSKEGFAQPAHIKDKEGKRIILSYYWDYDARKWTDYEEGGITGSKAHCISAVAFDWNGDGALDLLLGDRNGGLWLQLNEGSSKEPKFSGASTPVMIGDKPLNAGGKMTAPVLVDWDKDGLTDLVVGTFQASKPGATGGVEGGGVKWFRNAGKKGAPAFEEAKVLIPGVSRAKLESEPARPDQGLYVSVTDYNGDGKLDLIVGGYSTWKAEATEEKKAATNMRKPFVWVYMRKTEPRSEAKTAPADEERS